MCRSRVPCCPSGHHCPEGLTFMLVFAIFSAVLGMFQFGYNTSVINPPQKVLEEFIADIYRNRTGQWITEERRDTIWSITVSIFAVGGMIGGISGGGIANWCGRKCGLLLNNAIAMLGATLMSSSQLFNSIECLIMGRFFIGLNCGLNTALVPMYLSEIAPMTLRGALGTVSQLAVTIGLLLGQVLGLSPILGNKQGWPFLLGISFIPAILQLLLLPFCPESPRYLLITKGRLSESRSALQRLRCSSDVDDDLEEMRIENRAVQPKETTSIWDIIRNKELQMPLVIGIVMQLSQQLSGINAIFYYSTNIFIASGLSDARAQYATIGVGAVMVIMTLVSIPLMDKAGRRTLHLYGLGGMFITSIFLTISMLVQFVYAAMSYISVTSILIFVVFFAIGPGSIPWMITAELFNQSTRPAAMSIAVLVNWSTNFVVGLGFPFMRRTLENYSFLPFTCFLAIFWTFTYHKVPETKNRTFDEIAALFRRDDYVSDADSTLQQTGQSQRKSVQSEIVYDTNNDKSLGDTTYASLRHAKAPSSSATIETSA
ncbi:Glucose transporter type 1 [Halotydeus destructor]|nr:Glucose transporter type 1 [Halotydeus destructor]